MKFTKYNSIENSYRIKQINTIIEQGKSDGVWCVEEKIHGSNLSFWYDGKEIKVAKRTAFLGNNSNFFNWEVIYDDLKPKIEKMWNEIKRFEKDLEFITIYGEIFGGSYNHPDVKRSYNAIKVQKEVQYHPENKFYCFDIAVNGTFVNKDTLIMLCEKFDIFFAKSLFEGTFQECLEFKNEYPTTIPALFGLPEIEGNICEGNVIRPKEPKFFWNGSRVILKNKNGKFKEKHDKGDKTPKTKEQIKLSEQAQKVLDEAVLFVHENRLRNVLSKMEKITDKMFGVVMGNLNKDTIEDFLKENKEEFLKLDKKEQKFITKKIGALNSNMLRENFLNIIDNNF